MARSPRAATPAAILRARGLEVLLVRKPVKASEQERRRPLPGDEFIAEPIASLTHAITIRRPPGDVWPWLAQMGAGSRAGWYSYDFLDNRRRPSATRIRPELQEIAIGTLFPALPGVTEGFVVTAFEPRRFLVLGFPAPDGSAMVTWAFVLEPADGGTRLIVRARAAGGYRFHGLPNRVIQAGHAVMQGKQLREIARRAEGRIAVGRGRRVARSSIAWLAAGAAAAVGTYAGYAGVAWLRYGRARPAREADERDEPLDRFMPEYDVVERHHVRVAAPAPIVLATAREFDLLGAPVVRAIVKSREVVMRAAGGERRIARGLIAEMQSLGWGVLADDPDREIVMGAVTRPWEPDVTFRAVPPGDFAAFAEPGYVKIAWTLRADSIGQGRSVFRTETRAAATDATARARFRRYWAFLSPGIILIRRAAVRGVKRDAERRARAAA